MELRSELSSHASWRNSILRALQHGVSSLLREPEGERSGRWWRVTLHVQTCSGRNRIIPLMWRPNTDSTPNMPVTLPRNQLLIRYVVTIPVHTVMIRCYGSGNVTSVYGVTVRGNVTVCTVLRYVVTLQCVPNLTRVGLPFFGSAVNPLTPNDL
jgi:hypothetical protein